MIKNKKDILIFGLGGLVWLTIAGGIAYGVFWFLDMKSEYENRLKKSQAKVPQSRSEDIEEFVSIVSTKEDLAKGKAIYSKYCVGCHGENGEGDGPAAFFLTVKPRNFSKGIFKIRSTPSGIPPTDGDLILTIRTGMPGSTMPSFTGILSNEEQKQVVGYLKEALIVQKDYQRVTNELNIMDIGKPVPSTPDSINRGKELYLKMECNECHGIQGRGDGNLNLIDDWGNPVLPADLTKAWNFRGARNGPYDPKNVVRTLSTGMDGAPMKSYSDRLNIEARWHLANYVISLSAKTNIDPVTQKPCCDRVIQSTYQKSELPTTVDDPAWSQIDSAIVPLISNIIRGSRKFVHTVDDIRIRSLHNKESIVFLLEWNDRTETRGGVDRSPVYDAEKLGIFNDENPTTGEKRFLIPDAVAAQFPQKWESFIPKQPFINQKKLREELGKGGTGPLYKRIKEAQFVLPYFIHGDQKLGVDLWKWNAKESIRVFTGRGLNHLTERKEGGGVQSTDARYSHGQWQIILKRSLITSDKEFDVQFKKGRYIPVSFFVWDGDAGDVKGRMALSSYVNLLLGKPKEGEPMSFRTVHPTPPKILTVNNTKFILTSMKNPFRSKGKPPTDSDFVQSAIEGEKLYFGKGACFYCHGTALDGRGLFSSAMRKPISFMSRGTIDQLQDGYVFWEIAKGGLGLPKDAHPWNSPMPAGEDYLTIDEVWNVVNFLYWRTGHSPRA